MDIKSLKKYISSFFFVTIFTIFFTSSVFGGETESNVAIKEIEEVHTLPLYESASTKTFYNINDVVNYIMEEAKKFTPTITFKYEGNIEAFSKNLSNEIKKALTKENNDYVHGTLNNWKFNARYSGGLADVTITLGYIGTLEQEKYVTEKVKEIAKSLTKPGMSDLEKVIAVNNYVVTNTVYTENTNTTPHHPYTLLKEGKGVCQAYALMTYRLLTEMGVETRYIVGKSKKNGIGHAWNSVKINGKWYHLDTTWNDISFSPYNSSYKYFLVNSDTLRQDHFWEEDRYPVANDNQYNYFHTIYLGVEHNGFIYGRNAHDGYLYKVNINTGKSERLVKSSVGTVNIFV